MRLTASTTQSTPTIDRLLSRTLNPGPTLRRTADVLRQNNARYVKTARYRPLDPEYAAEKAEERGTTRPLVGGSLEASITNPRHRWHLTIINRNEVRVGTKHPLANIHRKGARIGKRVGRGAAGGKNDLRALRMPRRVPVRLTPKHRRAALEALRADLLGRR